MRIGANYRGNGLCDFTVWAPFQSRVAVNIVEPDRPPVDMENDERGYWRASITDVVPGTTYFYRLDGDTDRPDPASSFQPQTVHGPSAVIDHLSFLWGDRDWRGVPLDQMIIYEVHTGTFTPDGTFDAIQSRLADLVDLGINALELMPVAQFPGERNWGYDGVSLFAPQNSYGGPDGLKRLIDACHRVGISVVLDVVYNHLGPEGNYLENFAPYFTDRYQTPWGKAINMDGPGSDEVRNYLIENALQWFECFHVDALRLDAIHAMFDRSAKPFLQELVERTDQLSTRTGREFYLIAESNLNDVRHIRPRDLGGIGLHAQWCDDFHHSLCTQLSNERSGYYVDFGALECLAKSLREGFVFDWRYSLFRRAHYGSSSVDRSPSQFVVFSQNHDQVGNRLLGERISALVSLEAQKLAAGAVLLSPYVPLLFMGEEYGETAPFLYFVSHADPALVEAVRAGRKEEFRQFDWRHEPPDPQSPDTFQQSKLHWELRELGSHRQMLAYYRLLIRLRKSIPALSGLSRDGFKVESLDEKKVLAIRRRSGDSEVAVVLNFEDCDARFQPDWQTGARRLLDSASSEWGGPGSLLAEVIPAGVAITLRPLSVLLLRLESGK
jgi:maltooligosyltrehalose trehalohydrolase